MDFFSIPGIRLVCHMVDSSEEGWIIPKSVRSTDHVSGQSTHKNPRAPWGCSSQGGPWGWHLSWCDHRPFLEKKRKVTYPCAALSIPHMAISKMEFWYFDICAMLSCNCLNGYMNPKRIDDHPSIDLPLIWSWHWHISKGGTLKKQGLFHHSMALYFQLLRRSDSSLDLRWLMDLMDTHFSVVYGAGHPFPLAHQKTNHVSMCVGFFCWFPSFFGGRTKNDNPRSWCSDHLFVACTRWSIGFPYGKNIIPN